MRAKREKDRVKVREEARNGREGGKRKGRGRKGSGRKGKARKGRKGKEREGKEKKGKAMTSAHKFRNFGINTHVFASHHLYATGANSRLDKNPIPHLAIGRGKVSTKLMAVSEREIESERERERERER